MDLRFTPEEVAFRDDLRRFFRTEIPAEIRRKVAEGRHLSKEDIVASQRILNAQGLAVPHWPAAWGGRDWTPVQRYIYTEELQRAAVPLPLQFNVYMVGPVIAAFGSEEQKRRFLPATANLDIWWCQGFSEPGAGSDLASLKTRAERQGDRYLVNGQKAWTTLGQYADWIFCLVRTDRDAKKPDPVSSILKIKGSELQQAATELLLDIAGPFALPRPAGDGDHGGPNDPLVGPEGADTAAPL